MKRSRRFRVFIFEVTLSRFRHLRARNGVSGNRVTHELGEPLRLDLSVCVNREAVTVYFDEVTINDNITLDKLKMNFERFRVSGQSRI
jgi:hypothetical protein